jgi:phenylpyruvate tautomerase PptA (4-oxalocrotonate tautomerase family)
MPTLRILTNAKVPDADRAGLLARTSAAVARILAKPEAYVMVVLEDGRDLLFAGSAAPAAYLELKSLHLPEGETGRYARLLCVLLQDELGIAPERVYIEFASPEPHLFGWNGDTF